MIKTEVTVNTKEDLIRHKAIELFKAKSEYEAAGYRYSSCENLDKKAEAFAEYKVLEYYFKNASKELEDEMRI
jgi:hypothetical protein